jgi:WD40 repeat protein
MGTQDTKLTLWRVQDGQMIRTIEQGRRLMKHPSTGEEVEVTAFSSDLAFSPDGKILASANADSTVKLWDVPTGKLLKSFEFTSWMHRVVIMPDGRGLIAGGENDFFVWDLHQEREVCHQSGTDARMIALSANGKVLAVYKGLEAGIAIYDVPSLVRGKGRS